MIASVLTVLFFALSGVSNQRVAMKFGAMAGNFVRLALAATILGGLVFFLFRDTLALPTFQWFFLSGIIGFGFGDVALFLALERIGSRLAVLLTLCLAPLFAIILEWIWLGESTTWPIFGATVVILIGVALALKPGAGVPRTERRGSPTIGIIAGIFSGLGQGFGAVVSRRANEVAEILDIPTNGISAAFFRVVGGLCVAVLVVLAIRFFRKSDPSKIVKSPRKSLIFWILAAAICGPVAGVSCFQWALISLPSGIVLAVVATTPIVMIPLVAILEKDRPTRLALIGAGIAVAGVVTLTLLKKWPEVKAFFE